MDNVRDLLRTGEWLGFTADHDKVAADKGTPTARQAFAAKYGRPPAHVVVDTGIVFAGPIPQEKEVRVR